MNLSKYALSFCLTTAPQFPHALKYLLIALFQNMMFDDSSETGEATAATPTSQEVHQLMTTAISRRRKVRERYPKTQDGAASKREKLIAQVPSSLCFSFFLSCILLLAACASEPKLSPTQLAQEYVVANSVPMSQDFSSFILSDDRTPDGLTREAIESRIEWQYMELPQQLSDRIVSVHVIASADIPFDNQLVKATLPFWLTFNRETGLAMSATADRDASLAKVQVSGTQPTPTVAFAPKTEPTPMDGAPSTEQVPAPRPGPTAEPTASASVAPIISRELTDAISECIWSVAHSVEPPALPEDWLTHPQMMEYLQTMEMDTPERLHDVAKFDVEGLADFGDYSEVVYLVWKGSDVLNALTMHYLFCKDYWQGLEATEVTGHDDAIAAVAECSWQIARSDDLPVVPDGVQNLTRYELKTEAQAMVGLSLNASRVDATFRASIDDDGLPAEIVAEDWHFVFCGKEWEGDE